MKLFSKKTGKKTLALVLTLVMMLGVLPIIGGDVASATYDHTITFANTDTIHSGSGNSGNQKFIGNSGIEIWGGDELVPSMGSNYLSLNLYSGQYKQFTIQVGANVPNGSNNYNSEGFQLTANQAYKLTINAQAASDSFKLRQNINNTALTNWATFGTTATDQEIEFVLTSHNIVLDTWDTTTGNTLIINSIRIQSLAPPPITNLDGTSDVVIPGTDLVAGSAVTLSQQISTSARVTHTSGYSAGNVVMFNVNLTNGVLITDYESIKITYTGVSGDYNHKDVRLTAVPRASGVVSASTSPSANHLIGMQSTGDASNAVTLEYLLVNTAANNAIDTLDNESEIRFALWIWGGPDAIYEISDITFVKKLCEHIWASNPTHHWCTKTDCVLHTPATHNAVAGSNANCVPCGRVPAFRAVSQIGTVTWTNNFVTRGIGLDAATRTALRTANVESARITIETGAPAVNTEMRFALNSATLGNVGGMQYIEFNSNDIKDKVIDFDLTKGNGINWASGWIEFGLEYTAAASFTFSVELLNAKGEIVFGAGAGDGEEDDPPPVSEAIYEMTVENRDAFLADGQSGGGLRAVGNAKYAASGDGILVSGRTNSWEGLDIMASVFTAGKRYRVDVVISSVGEAQTFSLENTDSPWGVFTQREGTSNVNLIATENASAFLDPQRGVRIRTAGSSVVGDGDFIIHSIRIFEVPPVDVTIPGHVENGVWRPELTPELLDQIISESSGSVARINLSNSTVHSAALSITALSQIATASHSAQIVMPGGMTMTLPPAVLTHLASAATTAGVHDVVLGMAPVAHSAIPEAQAGNIATGDAVFSITLTAGTTAITDLGGSISVTLPWEGPWPAVVWHLAADGTLTRMTTTYNQAGGTVTFTTNHLSMFLVRQGDSSTASNGVVIFLGLAGTALAVSGAGIVIATKKLRKK